MKNEPAFPTLHFRQQESWSGGEHSVPYLSGGLTKRELFAAMAMQAYITSPGRLINESDGEPIIRTPEHFALAATQAADALIQELEKEKTDG